MEKKGDLLNQLAIISDLIERVNADLKTPTVFFQLDDEEFKRVYGIIEKKYGTTGSNIEDTFSIKIGTVDIMFNKSSA